MKGLVLLIYTLGIDANSILRFGERKSFLQTRRNSLKAEINNYDINFVILGWWGGVAYFAALHEKNLSQRRHERNEKVLEGYF